MIGKRRLSTARLGCAVLLAVIALGAVACGDDDEEKKPASRDSQQERQVERAFLTAMVSHHQMAIDMAAVAQQRSEDRSVKRLATAIVAAQEQEIEQMKSIHRRLFRSELKPDARAHDGLGLTAEQAGMTHTAHTNDRLRDADPFDRAFVDAMVPHHRGAIAMSTVVLDQTSDRGLRKLANGIIETQRREIEDMNELRTERFGGPAPEGADHGKGSAETSTGHESH